VVSEFIPAVNPAAVTFGLDTFGDMTVKLDGTPDSAAQVIRNIVEQAKLADELGLANFNIGEHHRDDFAVSAPDTVLAGIATVTKNITLGTGVTVLSSDDPVRVYQRFATIDALSNGRAEITAGRGSFTESFPLFGYELSDYNVLFEEKLELLVELFKEGPVTWHGTTRKPLKNQEIYPKTESGAMKMRVGVGGSPESVIRAARLGIPMALAIIGGDPARFAPYANLYYEALEKFCRSRFTLRVTSPQPIKRPKMFSGLTTRNSSIASVANADGVRQTVSTSSKRFLTVRFTSVRLTRLPRRLRMRFCRSVPRASTLNMQTGRCLTSTCSSQSSSMQPRLFLAFASCLPRHRSTCSTLPLATSANRAIRDVRIK
jgi:hypothetical protein